MYVYICHIMFIMIYVIKYARLCQIMSGLECKSNCLRLCPVMPYYVPLCFEKQRRDIKVMSCYVVLWHIMPILLCQTQSFYDSICPSPFLDFFMAFYAELCIKFYWSALPNKICPVMSSYVVLCMFFFAQCRIMSTCVILDTFLPSFSQIFCDFNILVNSMPRDVALLQNVTTLSPVIHLYTL